MIRLETQRQAAREVGRLVATAKKHASNPEAAASETTDAQ